MTTDEILDRVLAREGGYVNHPADRGGPTNFGITQATLSEWRRTPATEADVRALTADQAKDIYRVTYLSPFSDAPQDVREQLFDIAVNSGVGTARRLWTAAQAQTRRPPKTQLVVERLRHYGQIVKKNPSQSVFIAGWIERAVSFL